MALRRLSPVLLSLVLFGLVSGRAASAAAPIDPRIFAGRATGASASFLVVLRDDADLSAAAQIPDRVERIRFVYEALRAQAEVSQRGLRERLSRAGIPFRAHFLVNMVEVEGPHDLARELAARPEVSSVAANPRVALAPEPAVSGEGLAPRSEHAAADVEPNIAKIGAPQVWARGFTGQGIVIGDADTGLAWTHPAILGHYRGTSGGIAVHDYNWHDAIHDAAFGNPCGSDSPVPCDDDGHGTGTAAVTVGDDGEGNQVGVAPGAKLIACRNMDRGVGTPARYTECFEWFLAPTDSHGANPRPDLAPHVVNNSWSCPAIEGCTDPNVLKAVVDHVTAAGIFLSFAAGNSGPGCGTTTEAPGFYASAFAVGATSQTDDIANFSSRGPATADASGRLKPDIAAPGEGIRTAEPAGGYRTFTGTSAASPHVAGAVALLWSAVPYLARDVPRTAALLEQTAAHLTSTQDCAGFPGAAVPNAVFGWGRLDIFAAVALAPPPVEREVPVRPPARPRVPRVLAR